MVDKTIPTQRGQAEVPQQFSEKLDLGKGEVFIKLHWNKVTIKCSFIFCPYFLKK